MHLKCIPREQKKLNNRSLLIESAISEFVSGADTIYGIVHKIMKHEGKVL